MQSDRKKERVTEHPHYISSYMTCSDVGGNEVGGRREKTREDIYQKQKKRQLYEKEHSTVSCAVEMSR